METPSPSSRTLTIDEAAAMTGLSKIAVQRRVDRGTLRAVVRDGRRRLPVSELRRAGLLDGAASTAVNTDGGASTRSTDSTPHGAGTGDGTAVTILIDRLEAQAGQLAETRLLMAQAESRVAAETQARAAVERELHEVRAELVTVRAQLEAAPHAPPADTAPAPQAAGAPSRPWWAIWRSEASVPPDARADGSIPGMPPPT